MRASTRIVANVLASYGRLFALAMVGLFATPIALRQLGSVDYGIFSVIGGSLALLMFINTALTTGAQRHIAYSLGEENTLDAARWFSASLMVHVFLGVIIGGAALLSSNWILFKLLHLPAERIVAAEWVYRMVVVAMCCNLISTPYQALLMAHEAIVSLSCISFVSGAALLGGVLCLKHLHGDSLLWYSAIYSLSQVVMFLGPIAYCLYRYPECRRIPEDLARRQRIRELLSFSGWNFFGALSTVARAQGPAILLNIFVGPVANAAYGLALQANGFASNISGGVLRATTSPIIKRQASSDQHGMGTLSNLSNTCAFGVLWLAIAPVLWNMHFCLRIWLHNVPPFTNAFVILMIVALLVDQLTLGFLASVQATGRIALYQMIVGTVNCLGVPIAYLLLRNGMSASVVVWGGILAAALAGLCRIWLAAVLAKISAVSWLRSVLLPCMACVVGSCAVVQIPLHLLTNDIGKFAMTALLNLVVGGYILWRLGATHEQRSKFTDLAVRVNKIARWSTDWSRQSKAAEEVARQTNVA
jgi:O-antigen/teichoic acid export membrane protein